MAGCAFLAQLNKHSLHKIITWKGQSIMATSYRWKIIKFHQPIHWIFDCLLKRHKNKSSKPRNKHGDVIKWKHFPRYWPFAHKGQWRGALMFSLICAWANVWVNNRDTGDLRRHHAHYDVIAMAFCKTQPSYLWYRDTKDLCLEGNSRGFHQHGGGLLNTRRWT